MDAGPEFPQIPGHLIRALEFTPIEDDIIIEVWQVLCDQYGQSWAGEFQITIQCPDTRRGDDFDIEGDD